MPRSPTRLPLSPAPITRHEPGSLPPYLSNGLIGLRPRWTPPVTGVAIVNGFVGVDPVTQTEGFALDPRPRSHPLGAAGRAASQVEGRGLIVLRPRR